MQTPSLAPARALVPAGVVSGLKAGWQRLPSTDRRLISVGAALAVVLLIALVQTCQASVQKGERLRAEQRQQAVAGTEVAMFRDRVA